jgi:hypothetical protein
MRHGRCQCGDRRDADVRAGARGRARGREHDHGEADVPEDEPDEAAQDRGDEAPERDGDEEERVQALEYRA